MSKVKVGLIGCGYWGPKLARNFNELADSELAWASDFSDERLAHIKGLYPQTRVTKDYQELLASDVDAVTIATPVFTHHHLAMDALWANKHVLVEKPLAANSVEAREIAQTADELRRVAMVGHTFQYNPAVDKVREVIASGDLGQVYYLHGTRVNLGLLQPDINVVWDLAPHDISILIHVLGMEPLTVSARGEAFVRHHTPLHEVAYVTVHFPRNIMATLRLSWLDPVKARRMTVVGSKKMLVYDDIADNKVVVYDKNVEVPPYSDTPEQFHMSYRHGAETVLPLVWQEPLRAECAQFIRSIRTGERPCSDAWMGLKVVRVLEAAQASIMNGGCREQVRSEQASAWARKPPAGRVMVGGAALGGASVASLSGRDGTADLPAVSSTTQAGMAEFMMRL